MTDLSCYLQSTLDDAAIDRTPRRLASGVRVQELARGALVLEPANPAHRAADVVLSACIHGNETAPAEICEALVRDIASGTIELGVRVLFLLGNIEAMRRGVRYVDDDLNRLFRSQLSGPSKLPSTVPPNSYEARRVVELASVTRHFFEQGLPLPAGVPRLNCDLHTAVRGSAIERFGLAPYRSDGRWDHEELHWLAGAGMEAILLNDGPAGTFSFFTSAEFAAKSATLELGEARPFKANDLTRFVAIDRSLRRLLRGDRQVASDADPLRVFRVVHVIVKTSDAFQLHVSDAVLNFTAYPRGTLMAEDEGYRYVVQHPEERIVFPNRAVKHGLRAGLMLASGWLRHAAARRTRRSGACRTIRGRRARRGHAVRRRRTRTRLDRWSADAGPRLIR